MYRYDNASSASGSDATVLDLSVHGVATGTDKRGRRPASARTAPHAATQRIVESAATPATPLKDWVPNGRAPAPHHELAKATRRRPLLSAGAASPKGRRGRALTATRTASQLEDALRLWAAHNRKLHEPRANTLLRGLMSSVPIPKDSTGIPQAAVRTKLASMTMEDAAELRESTVQQADGPRSLAVDALSARPSRRESEPEMPRAASPPAFADIPTREKPRQPRTGFLSRASNVWAHRSGEKIDGGMTSKHVDDDVRRIELDPSLTEAERWGYKRQLLVDRASIIRETGRGRSFVRLGGINPDMTFGVAPPKELRKAVDAGDEAEAAKASLSAFAGGAPKSHLFLRGCLISRRHLEQSWARMLAEEQRSGAAPGLVAPLAPEETALLLERFGRRRGPHEQLWGDDGGVLRPTSALVSGRAGAGGYHGADAVDVQKLIDAVCMGFTHELKARTVVRAAPSPMDEAGEKRYLMRFCRKALTPPTGLDVAAASRRSAESPSAYLELEHVYGYAGLYNTDQNLFYTADGSIATYTAGIGMVCDPLEAAEMEADSGGREFVEAPPLMRFFRGHTDDVGCVAMHPGGRLCATGQCAAEPSVSIWDSQTCKERGRLRLPYGHRSVTAAAFSGGKGRWLTTVSTDNEHTVIVWDWKVGRRVCQGNGYKGHPPQVLGCIWDHHAGETGDERFATFGRNHLKLWYRGVDLKTRMPTWTGRGCSWNGAEPRMVLSAVFLPPSLHEGAEVLVRSSSTPQGAVGTGWCKQTGAEDLDFGLVATGHPAGEVMFWRECAAVMVLQVDAAPKKTLRPSANEVDSVYGIRGLQVACIVPERTPPREEYETESDTPGAGERSPAAPEPAAAAVPASESSELSGPHSASLESSFTGGESSGQDQVGHASSDVDAALEDALNDTVVSLEDPIECVIEDELIPAAERSRNTSSPDSQRAPGGRGLYMGARGGDEFGEFFADDASGEDVGERGDGSRGFVDEDDAVQIGGELDGMTSSGVTSAMLSTIRGGMFGSDVAGPDGPQGQEPRAQDPPAGSDDDEGVLRLRGGSGRYAADPGYDTMDSQALASVRQEAVVMPRATPTIPTATAHPPGRYVQQEPPQLSRERPQTYPDRYAPPESAPGAGASFETARHAQGAPQEVPRQAGGVSAGRYAPASAGQRGSRGGLRAWREWFEDEPAEPRWVLVAGGGGGVVRMFDLGSDMRLPHAECGRNPVEIPVPRWPAGTARQPIRALDVGVKRRCIAVGTRECDVWELPIPAEVYGEEPGVPVPRGQEGVRGPHFPVRLVNGSSGEVRSAAWHPRAKGIFVIAPAAPEVLVYHAGRKHSIGRPIIAAANVTAVAFSQPTGEFLALGTETGVLQVFDSDKQLVAERHDTRRPVSCLAYAPSGRVLAAGSRDGSIALYDARNRHRLLTVCRGHSAAIECMDFSRDSRVLQSNCASYEILHWDVLTGRQLTEDQRDTAWATWTCKLGFPVIGVWPEDADGTDVNAVDRDPSGEYVVAADDFGNVRLFHYPCIVEGAGCVKSTGHSAHVLCARFSACGKRVLSVGGRDRAVFQWRLVRRDGGGAEPAMPEHGGVQRDGGTSFLQALLRGQAAGRATPRTIPPVALTKEQIDRAREARDARVAGADPDAPPTEEDKLFQRIQSKHAIGVRNEGLADEDYGEEAEGGMEQAMQGLREAQGSWRAVSRAAKAVVSMEEEELERREGAEEPRVDRGSAAAALMERAGAGGRLGTRKYRARRMKELERQLDRELEAAGLGSKESRRKGKAVVKEGMVWGPLVPGGKEYGWIRELDLNAED
ncbi:unnamed protein product [Pedinophyceae sp. YPF-701]|nr:unnamed protein product [Pedinophyceae sp. YPF-701]CAG9462364.1 unnamed protein product [Pedinophyceae sp. YPF-701]